MSTITIRFAMIFVVSSLAGCFPTTPVLAQDPAGRSGQTEASLANGTPIFADLNSGLDSKKVKVGDPVTAHTTEAVKSTDARTILPKGTRLVGHVAQASARSKGDGQSAIGIAFDKAVLKNGEEVPLSARIQALAAPASFASEMGSPSPENTGTTQTSPMGNPNRGVTPQVPTAPRDPGSTGGDSGSSQPGLSPNSRGVIGLHGLTLTTAPVENALVSTISSEGKNVRLDSNTRLLLVTQAVASEGAAQ